MTEHTQVTSPTNNSSGETAHLTQAYSANGKVVGLMVAVALLVLSQLYLAIPLLSYVGQAFSPSTPGAVTFALATCFSLAYAGGFLIWGPLSDQYGRRPVILIGLSALSVSTLVCAMAPSLPWLAGLRIIQGLAASSFAPVALAYLAEAMPARHRATAIGAMSTSFLVAGIFGQVLAGWMALRWEWFWVFLATGASLIIMIPFISMMVKEPTRIAVDGHLGHRFVALGKLVAQPAILLLSCAHIMLLLSFVAMYTALGPHMMGLGLDPAKVIMLRLVGLPGMFMALLVGPLAARIGMPGVAKMGYLVAAAGLALEVILSQSLVGIAMGSLIFVTGVALAVPAMITQFGELAVPNRAGGMALNGFVLFVGASIGPLIVAWVPGFTALLLGLTVALLLSIACIAGSASLSAARRKS